MTGSSVSFSSSFLPSFSPVGSSFYSFTSFSLSGGFFFNFTNWFMLAFSIAGNYVPSYSSVLGWVESTNSSMDLEICASVTRHRETFSVYFFLAEWFFDQFQFMHKYSHMLSFDHVIQLVGGRNSLVSSMLFTDVSSFHSLVCTTLAFIGVLRAFSRVCWIVVLRLFLKSLSDCG